jgi:hypothetical protein
LSTVYRKTAADGTIVIHPPYADYLYVDAEVNQNAVHRLLFGDATALGMTGLR